ncbi:MAG: hypothetical protein A2W80_13240 [Candidatus Riflebacteria bacterium GWC2_50_8]|nr:MAG: hypothetical protein A2W80_13240 [Candidatus Riflebacteria bacterium GWC2_50_8]
MKKLHIAVLFAWLILPAAFAQSLIIPETREYKVLLDISKFSSAQKCCELFRDLFEKVADDHGFPTKRTDRLSPDREICFIDTPEFDLNKSGFLLRLRAEKINISKVEKLLQPTDDAELTLKFRAESIETAIIAPVESEERYGSKVSAETDVVVKSAAPISIFSRSCGITDFGSTPASIEELLKYYPRLALAGLNGSHKLKVVNDIVIIEQRLLQGSIEFGRKKSKSLFSIWYKKGESKPMLAEFSFKIKTKSYIAQNVENSQNRVDNFFVDLISRSKPFTSQDQTKTGMVYQYQSED